MVHAIQLHKVILEHSKEKKVIPISQLAQQLNLSEQQITISLEVLKNMNLIEINSRGMLKLTTTGQLVHLE